ncbi:glycosyltransferase [Candidatus Daviesbacteria bacterium]|nr:glycosyltransferase [Candidatus Daviesbacteria bacterium]
MKIYPTVSIIVPTKNEEQNIGRCLKSIKRQKYGGKIEIIVVDNFSEDKTVKLAKLFTKKVFLQGSERSTQRNFGAQIAKGKYLLFIDADMELKSNTVTECISFYLYPIPYTLYPILALKEHSQGTTFWGRALALERNCYHDATWLLGARFFPKKDFLKIGGYDPKLIAAEDWDLTLRFAKAGYSTQISRISLITHHESKDSLSKLLQKELYYIRNIKNYQKKHPKALTIQSNLAYRLAVWIKSWRKLINHPMLTLAFLWYKLTVWILWNIEKFNENR